MQAHGRSPLHSSRNPLLLKMLSLGISSDLSTLLIIFRVLESKSGLLVSSISHSLRLGFTKVRVVFCICYESPRCLSEPHRLWAKLRGRCMPWQLY